MRNSRENRDLDTQIETYTRLQKSIHHRHWRQWIDLVNIFRTSGDPDLEKRARRIESCCDRGALYLSGDDPPDVRVWVHRCYDRLCPLCSGYRSRTVRGQLEIVLLSCTVAHHMVLTLKADPNRTLSDSLNELKRCFRVLRQTVDWKLRIKGGAYVIEITRNRETQTWHPHLHILYSGNDYPHNLLSDQWKAITEGSFVVWIARATREQAGHLSKYCGKPANLHSWPHSAVVEYATSTTNLRMVQTFGSLYDLKLSDADKKPKRTHATHRISFRELRHLTATGNPVATRILKCICDRHVALRGLAQGLIDLPPPDTPMIDRKDDEQWNATISQGAKFLRRYCQEL